MTKEERNSGRALEVGDRTRGCSDPRYNLKTRKCAPFISAKTNQCLYLDWDMMESLNCGATGIAALAVEAIILIYHIVIVSRTLGCFSSCILTQEREIFQRNVSSIHAYLLPLTCSPLILTSHPSLWQDRMLIWI